MIQIFLLMTEYKAKFDKKVSETSRRKMRKFRNSKLKKERQYNEQKKNDKQRSTKHYTENRTEQHEPH